MSLTFADPSATPKSIELIAGCIKSMKFAPPPSKIRCGTESKVPQK